MSHDEVIDRADADLDQDAPAPLDVVLPVEVIGPVRIQDLPVHIPETKSVTLPADTAEQLLSGDPRRSRAIIISTDTDFYVGTSRGQVANGAAAVWPAFYPLFWHGRGAVWVRNASATSPTRISAISEVMQ